MEGILVLVVLIVVIGGGCGIFAALRLKDLTLRLNRIEEELAFHRHPLEKEGPSETEAAREPQARVAAAEAPPPREAAPPTRSPALSAPAPFAPPAAHKTPTLKEQWSALEIVAGTKWLNWAGILLVTIGVLFFLKFAYDNQWIGPRGRIAIGAILGATMLIFGERLRRREYPMLFQSLTAGGLAAFYGCVFFSFQVYQLMGQRISFLMLILITALALAMALIHNARLICLFAQLGGFLSPILISTGENRPVELFIFVIVLNFATMGCAYFRNWRDVNVVAFVGTWLLYGGWVVRFYDRSHIEVALIFSILFYLIFLVVPTLRAAARREALAAQDLYLIALNTVVSFVNNHTLLDEAYRSWLGLAVVIQSLTLATMYSYWARRCPEDAKTRVTLLLGALALAVAAVPIQLNFYAIPLAWSVEALLFGVIGLQYRQRTFQWAALAAIILAAGGLVVRLPLHTALFVPVFNRPFGDWACVIGLAFGLQAAFRRYKDGLDDSLKSVACLPAVLAIVLLCVLIHLEVFTFWEVRLPIMDWGTARSYQYSSVIVLWSVIPISFLLLGQCRLMPFSGLAALAAYTVGFLLVIQATTAGSWISWGVPFLNFQWLSRFAFVVSLWLGAAQIRAITDGPIDLKQWPVLLPILEGTGHCILVFLAYAEVDAWLAVSKTFSPFMRYGFVSALWSLQALLLIGIGLRTRNGFRRIFGFILFGVTVAKLLAIDMAVLQPVYRIISFAVTGVLLLVAAFLYQKFARALLESNNLPPTKTGENAA
ncbi:MAG TPA: DUF2339 domain-containing protein [Candidatus Binatia bacterium]|jgi:uncharacterized membrane protein